MILFFCPALAEPVGTKKGPSVDALQPFDSGTVADDIKTAAQLRALLER
jgi:hypothetical protein